MMKKFLSILVLSISMTSGTLSQTLSVRDDSGHNLTVRGTPNRIISLAPNITEILFALGLEDHIVGVTRYCDFPEGAGRIEKIGGLVDPSLEKIQALRPDLVIGFRGNPIRTLERIRSLDLPLFVLEMGNSLESVFRIIRTVGEVTARREEACRLAGDMEQKYQKIRTAVRSSTEKPKVFFLLSAMGLWTGGRGSFLHDLIEKAGGLNIAAEIRRKWLHYNREHLIHENPEIILIICRSKKEYSRAKEWLEKDPSFQNILAVRKGNVWFIDEDLATRPGPRLILAFTRVAEIIHPEVFAGDDEKKP